MDLIYTNSNGVDQGVLQDYEIDLAFGADENNLECRVQSGNHCCEAGSFLYVEGTEYGGVVDSIESKTDKKEVTYRGRTWHGILNSKVLQPDSGESYLVANGEANAVLADLMSRLTLTDLFEVSSEDSGLIINNYKMNRYIKGYDGIRKMLGTVGGKLKVSFNGSKVVLSAAKVHDYTQDDEFDADQVPFTARRNYKGVNHLICLGSGQLAERMVVHLYADAEGNISREQTQFGIDEVCSIYEYSNIESENDLIQQGMDEFKNLKATDEISIDFDADSAAYDVGDIIGAVDNITGLMAYTTIAKKIVTIKNGKITVSLSPDTAKAGSSSEIGGGSSGGGGGGGTVDAYTKGETDALLAEKAPAGFGYGGELEFIGVADASETMETYCAKLDAVIATMPNGTAKQITATPPGTYGAGRYIATIYRYFADFVAVVGFSSTNSAKWSMGWRIVKTSNVWQPFEWDNPPMVSGVEYRTTERIANKAVYKKNDNGVIQYRLDGETEWKPYADVVGAVKKSGDTMTGNLNITASGSSSTTNLINYASQTTLRNIVDNNNYVDINFGDGILDYTGKIDGTGFRYNLLHTGNISTHTTTMKQIGTGGYCYNNVAHCSTGMAKNKYYRIALPEGAAGRWAMIQMEVSVSDNYGSGQNGKVLICGYHGTNVDWVASSFRAIKIGLLANVNVYGSNGRYFYISGCGDYSSVSIDKILCGDSVAGVDISSTTIDIVSELPSTYTTAANVDG